MKRFKRLVSLVTMIAMITIMLAGCGKSKDDSMDADNVISMDSNDEADNVS